MVNIGRPSRGCAVCRRRRIKCDEKEPQCSYCVKTKQNCPGYKDDFTLAWRDETNSAREKVQRRKRAQKQTSPSSERCQTPFSSSTTVTNVQRATSIPPQMVEDVQQYALSYFFDTHINVASDPDCWRGFMEYIPFLFPSAGVDSPLYMAIMTLAMRMYEPWIDVKRQFTRSRALYFKALTRTRESMERNENCWSDEFLMTTLVLDMYECLQGLFGRKVETHLTGAASLIRNRPLNTYESEVSRGLLLAVRNQLQTNSLRTNTPFPADMLSIFWQTPHLPPNFSRKLDTIELHISFLQAALASVGNTRTLSAERNINVARSDQYTPYSFIQQALFLDSQLTDLAAHAPRDFIPIRVTGAGIPASVRAAGGVYEYPLQNSDDDNDEDDDTSDDEEEDRKKWQERRGGGWAEHHPKGVFVANVWNSYRCARIRVHAIVLKSIEYLLSPETADVYLDPEPCSSTTTTASTSASASPVSSSAALDPSTLLLPAETELFTPEVDLAAQYEGSLAIVQRAADDICASVPFFLGDRTKHSTGADDRNVRFPFPVGVKGGKVPEEQYRATAAMGRWFLIPPFSVVLGLGCEIRAGQKEWIRGQIERMARIHGGRREGDESKD